MDGKAEELRRYKMRSVCESLLAFGKYDLDGRIEFSAISFSCEEEGGKEEGSNAIPEKINEFLIYSLGHYVCAHISGTLNIGK